MITIKEDTHIVIKREDVNKYLNDLGKERLDIILSTILLGRERDRLPDNLYYVCNQDEPYADKVLQAVLDGEAMKEGKK